MKYFFVVKVFFSKIIILQYFKEVIYQLKKKHFCQIFQQNYLPNFFTKIFQ